MFLCVCGFQANTTFEFLGNLKQLAVDWLALDLNATVVAALGVRNLSFLPEIIIISCFRCENICSLFQARIVTLASWSNITNRVGNLSNYERIADVTEWENVIDSVNSFMRVIEKFLEVGLCDHFSIGKYIKICH